MDWIDLRKKLPEMWQKYKYVILILVIGLVLMLLPEDSGDTKSQETAIGSVTDQSESDEERLARILSQIENAGDVQVLLSRAKGEETIYQTDDENVNGEETGTLRIETVIISDGDRGEHGLVRQVNPAVYQGAVVVCQGGDDPTVRLAIVDAVSDITGLGSDRISVLKMK